MNALVLYAGMGSASHGGGTSHRRAVQRGSPHSSIPGYIADPVPGGQWRPARSDPDAVWPHGSGSRLRRSRLNGAAAELSSDTAWVLELLDTPEGHEGVTQANR